MFAKRPIYLFVALATLFLLGHNAMTAAAATPEHTQVTLEAAMAYPTLLANKKQTTFVKVGLTGYQLTSQQERAAVNVAIVLDKSGSMAGDKLANAKAAAIGAIERLQAQDIVSIVTYDSTVEVLVPATRLTDKASVVAKIRQIEAGGSTALFGGVSKGAEELRKFLDRERVNRVILLSDGLANVGPQSPGELGELGASLIKENISVSTMGLGLDYNEDLMAKLADKSDGNHVFVRSPGELTAFFKAEFDDVMSVVAQEVVINIECADGIRPVRVINYDAEITGQNVIVKFNQIYSKQQKYLVLEVEVPASTKDQPRPIATVAASYTNMQSMATDRLSSSVGVNFTDDSSKVVANTNKLVAAHCVLQVANQNNLEAILLRDKGDAEGARALLLFNSTYLQDSARELEAPELNAPANLNRSQADRVRQKWSSADSKEAREYQQQTRGNVNPRYIPKKVEPKPSSPKR